MYIQIGDYIGPYSNGDAGGCLCFRILEGV